MTTAEAIRIYRDAKGAGKDSIAACRILMAAGYDAQAAADISWRVETGKAMPSFDPETAVGRRNSASWAGGFERHHHPSDDDY